MLILGAQHMFAMFGATVLVPLLTGLSVSTTLLCAGLGTLLFHIICKGKVPAFWVPALPTWAALPLSAMTVPTRKTCPTPAQPLRSAACCMCWSAG